MTREPDDHTYAPRWWYAASLAVMSVPIAIFAVWLIDLDRVVAVGLVIVVPFVASRGLRLTLSKTGLTISNQTAGWNELICSESRWGTSLKSPKGTPWRRRVGAFLPLYERDWRRGHIGADLRRWAPDLLGNMPQGQ
jgi:hypothetical protein